MANSKKKVLFVVIPLLLGCWLLSFAGTMGEQKEQAAEKTERKRKKSTINVVSMIREEVHRFMGYEKLLPKYISMPYDITMNTNEQGAFINIGFFILLFLPILLFLSIKTTWIKVIYTATLLLFYILSSATGYGAFKNVSTNEVGVTISKELQETNVTDAPLHVIKLRITQLCDILYKPFDAVFEKISGEGDSISYPFLLFIYLLLVLLINKILQPISKLGLAMVFLLFTYSFWGWILSAGVVWYSMLLLPLGILLGTIGFYKINAGSILNKKWLKIGFLAIVTFWTFFAVTYRLSNYNPVDDYNSKGAINGATLVYGLGKANTLQFMNLLYPNYRVALNRINSETNSKVYRIATFFHYFIEENHRRVFVDNQIGYFNSLMTQIPDKKQLATHLKNAGYKYMIVDLNVATIDNTPDQSLTRKKDKLFAFLSNNPNVELITTDNVMLNSNGQPIYSIYGSNVQKRGTFAAFELK